MGDRAKQVPARAGGSRTPRLSLSTAAPLALFSLMTGVVAVGLGALATLLVPGAEAKGLVWLVVTVLVAASAGLWWGLTPGAERLRVLDRALTAARPRDARGR